jgi:hypothetical protein
MSSRITHSHVLGHRFGFDEDGFADIPVRFSNVRIARILALHNKEHGCGFCFPRKCADSLVTARNGRSWKLHRNTQYRPKQIGT